MKECTEGADGRVLPCELHAKAVQDAVLAERQRCIEIVQRLFAEELHRKEPGWRVRLRDHLLVSIRTETPAAVAIKLTNRARLALTRAYPKAPIASADDVKRFLLRNGKLPGSGPKIMGELHKAFGIDE